MGFSWVKFSGKTFVNVSAFNTAQAGLSRDGWGVVAIDLAGQLTGAMYGVVPLSCAPHQVARDGEDCRVSNAQSFFGVGARKPPRGIL